MLHFYWLHSYIVLKNTLYATIIEFDCSPSFDCILYFITVTYMKIESYIFVNSGPLHTTMLESCYTFYTVTYATLFCFCYYVYYADVLSRFSIEPLPCLVDIFLEGKQIQHMHGRALFLYIPVINHTLCIF